MSIMFIKLLAILWKKKYKMDMKTSFLENGPLLDYFNSILCNP